VQYETQSLRFFERVNVAALQIFDQLRLKCLSVGQMNDADRHSLGLGKMRGAVAARSGNDLKAVFGDGPDEQGRQNALAADGVGQFLEGGIVKDAARVGLGFFERSEWHIAVFSGNLIRHGCSLLLSGWKAVMVARTVPVALSAWWLLSRGGLCR
jgi:hypothetical protein